MRRKMNKRRDAKLFKATATKTKAINTAVYAVPRGGRRF